MRTLPDASMESAPAKQELSFSPTELETDGQKTRLDPMTQIQRLAELRDAGIVTEEEFQVKKRDLLDRM